MNYRLEGLDNFIEYLPLTSDGEKRLKRSLAIIEALWINGALSYSSIRNILSKMYNDKVSDKVLTQLLDFLKSKGLIVDVRVRISNKYRNFYVITGRGVRLFTSLTLSSYIDEYFFKNYFHDKEYYEYVKSILYSYYVEKKLYVSRDIVKIIIDNLEGLEKIVEITTSCREEDNEYDRKKCIETKLQEAKGKEIVEIVRETAKLFTENTLRGKTLLGECTEKIDGLIIHITGRTDDKAEIYSGYYYRWNPLQEIASIFAQNSIRFEKCSRIIYVKGSKHYIDLVLGLLNIMRDYQVKSLFYRETVDEEYVDSDPFREYALEASIQPDNTVIAIDTPYPSKINLDLTKFDKLIGRNIVIIARNSIGVKMNKGSSLAIVYHVLKPMEDKESLKIFIKENSRRDARLTRIDLYIVHMKSPRDPEYALPRLKLYNLRITPLNPPRIIVSRKNRLSTYILEINCGNRNYLLESLVNNITAEPGKAYDLIARFFEENVAGGNRFFIPICIVDHGKENSNKPLYYKALGSNDEIYPKGPLIEISEEHGMFSFSDTINMITVHVIMHGG